MDCKQRIIDLLTPNLQAVPTLEHDGSDYFVHIGIGYEDSPPTVTIKVDNTHGMADFLKSEDAKEIHFEWSGQYDIVNNGDPQQDVIGEADLDLVAHLEDWKYADTVGTKLEATFWIETL